VILLAIKPSGWFVLLTSWPVLVVAATVAAAAMLAGGLLAFDLPDRTICLFCLGAALLRVLFACAQWVGNLYLLTSRRVLNLSGVARVSIEQCPLDRIGQTRLTASAGESLLALASLVFQDRHGEALVPAWVCLSQPLEVKQAVDQAIGCAN
jgi:hypothetical protein